MPILVTLSAHACRTPPDLLAPPSRPLCFPTAGGQLHGEGDGQHHGVGHLLHRVVEGIKKVASHGKLHDDKAEAKQA